MRIKGILYSHTYAPLVSNSVFEMCQRRKRSANIPQGQIKETRHGLAPLSEGFERKSAL